MTGLITDIKRFAQHDGDGIRSTVFFQGCSLKCIWCHNPETQSTARKLQYFEEKCVGCGACAEVCTGGGLEQSNGRFIFHRTKCTGCLACAQACPTAARIPSGQQITAGALVAKLLEDKPFYAPEGGVTLSGGEPLLQADFAAEVAKTLHEAGVRVNLDTCGAAERSAFERILPYIDVFLFDIKTMDEALHKNLTGSDNLQILANLEYLLERNARVEIRFPYVPGCNDGETGKIAAFLKGKPIKMLKVLGYHDLARSKYKSLGMTDTMPRVELPTPTLLDRVVALLQEQGIPAVNGLKDDRLI